MAARPSLPALAPPTPAPAVRPVTRGIVVASYVLMAGTLLLIMWRGLLPGLLCVCLGYLVTLAFARWFTAGLGLLQVPGLVERRRVTDVRGGALVGALHVRASWAHRGWRLAPSEWCRIGQDKGGGHQ